MLEISRVEFSYAPDKRVDVHPRFLFDLRLPSIGTYAVTGISGAGKTTLLYLIAGFYPAAAGNIIFNGLDMTSLKPSERPVGMIFQENNLFAHLTVMENISLGILGKPKPTRNLKEKIHLFLDDTNLRHCAEKYPDTLSGGQRRRTALVREIMRIRGDIPLDRDDTSERVLLLDEPFNGLDTDARTQFKRLLKSIRRTRPITVIYTSHDAADIINFADGAIAVHAIPSSDARLSLSAATFSTIPAPDGQ